MSFIIPYTFTGGTSAKAQEVNDNFVAVKNYFNSIDDSISNLDSATTLLDQGKADKTGSDTIQFNVAYANTSPDSLNAIPYAQFNELIDNLKGIIKGFELTTYTTTPSGKAWGLVMGVGSCWDSTENHFIKNIANVTKSFEGQIVNPGATHNVWIVANIATLTSPTIQVTFGSSPTLGEGDVYRKLATIKTSNASGFGDITYVSGRI